jgi:CO/xanthine dehydrogenase FAD-binding subunit
MLPFSYARPTTVDEAVSLLDEYGLDAKLLAGGTDLLINLRDGDFEPRLVIDIKRIPDLEPAITEKDAVFTFTAGVVMTDIEDDLRVQELFPALVEAAEVVGSVQIRDRATLTGNICNGSPAADTTPTLLVYDATVVIAGPNGVRRMPIDDFIVGPGTTALERGELVTAIELPSPDPPMGAAYTRLVRRRGTDLASITMCVGVDTAGTTRIAFGSVGPRAFLVVDDSGVLADPATAEEARAELLDRMFEQASPSPTSLRASPAYRLAMLRVLGGRALKTAIQRLPEAS